MVRCSEQDAHKGHPFYGRGFEYIRDFGVKVGGYVAWIS